MRLNLGCGSQPRADGVVNVDIAALPTVDVVHDLDVHPWPWDDSSVKTIIAQDLYEHLGDPVGFMTESHRVLVPRGLLLLKVPHYLHKDAYTDPTHRRFCTESTWDYWIPGHELYELHNAAYGGVAFHLHAMQVVTGSIYVRLAAQK